MQIEQTILTLATYAFGAYKLLILVYVISSWIPSLRDSSFGLIIEKIVDPYLSIFRKVIPPLGGLDLSVIVAYLAYGVITSFALKGIAASIDIIQNLV